VELLRALDKVAKKGGEEVLREYSKKGFEESVLRKLLGFSGNRGSPDSVLKTLQEENLDAQENLAALRDALSGRGISNLEFNLGIVRGLDYYTGIVFEVMDPGSPELGALAG
jgi:histidyl-tRNA synthetase